MDSALRIEHKMFLAKPLPFKTLPGNSAKMCETVRSYTVEPHSISDIF